MISLLFQGHNYYILFCCSIQFSCSMVSDSLQPHGLQHALLPCLSPTSGVYPNSCPLSWWCHPTISSCAIPFSCLQSFPTLGSFLRNQFFTSGGQSIGASVSSSVLPMNSQDWFPLGLTSLIFLQSKRLSRKSISSSALTFFVVQLSHPYMTTGKTIALTKRTFVGKVMTLLFNMLSRLVISLTPFWGQGRQEYWHGLPFPSPGDLPDPGIELRSPTL